MAWSELVGSSIMLPSDRVEGDGRNYIIIGEDVPEAIADDFTAALVFWSGQPTQYPNGFTFYAIGISQFGALEIVVYYYTKASPEASPDYIRQTVFSLSTPFGIDNPPVLALGETGYGTYNEGQVRVKTKLDDIVPWTALTIPDPARWGFYPGTDPAYRVDACGTTHLRGKILAKTAGGWGGGFAIFAIDNPNALPEDGDWFSGRAFNDVLCLFGVDIANGYFTWQGSGPGVSYAVNQWINLAGISFKARGY